MAVVFSERVIEIAVIQDYATKRAVNVWHMQTSTELWPASAEDVVRDFANNWQDHIVEVQDDDLDLLRFEWRSLDPSDSSVGIMAPDPAKNMEGQTTGEGSPANVAVLLHKQTASRPRGRRDGRSYIVGVPEAHTWNFGQLTGPSLSTWQSAATAFYNGISDSGVFTNDERWPVVLETTPESRAPGTQSVTISSRRLNAITVDPVVATQRDRLR